MKLKYLLTIPILLIALTAFSIYLGDKNAVTEPVLATESVDVPVYEEPTPERLLELTNAERVKAGIKPLVIDERLNQSAQRKVDELVLEGWDDTPHVNDSGKHGYEYVIEVAPECYPSENLLANTIDVYEGFTWWINSTEGHKEAILNPNFDYVGHAYSNGYVVQHFCDII